MKKWQSTVLAAAVLLAAGSPRLHGASVYEKKLIKSRASRFKDQGGKSESGDVYLYADDHDVRDALDKARDAKGRRRELNLVSPVVERNSRTRDVNIVVDLKKDLVVESPAAGKKDEAKVNVASPKIEKGAKVRDLNIVIEAKEIRVK